MKTITLDVVAGCVSSHEAPAAGEASADAVESRPMGEASSDEASALAAVMPSQMVVAPPMRTTAGSGEHASVFVIHVAPSPRLDPSTDLDKIEIVVGGELAGFAGDLRGFIVPLDPRDRTTPPSSHGLDPSTDLHNEIVVGGSQASPATSAVHRAARST